MGLQNGILGMARSQFLGRPRQRNEEFGEPALISIMRTFLYLITLLLTLTTINVTSFTPLHRITRLKPSVHASSALFIQRQSARDGQDRSKRQERMGREVRGEIAQIIFNGYEVKVRNFPKVTHGP
jgi:hypothetical protein